jgi:hypothetical protein
MNNECIIQYWDGGYGTLEEYHVVISCSHKIFIRKNQEWMVFSRKDGVFQWVHTDDEPFYDSENPPVLIDINYINWNFSVFNDEGVKELTEVTILAGIDVVEYIWIVHWDGMHALLIPYEEAIGDFHKYGFHNTFNLSELKYDRSTMIFDRKSSKIEKREDPYNEDSFFTKEQFIEYYGSTLEWDFMSPEKVFKRNIISLWIVDNGKYMQYQSVNHLLDKMIETFL